MINLYSKLRNAMPHTRRVATLLGLLALGACGTCGGEYPHTYGCNYYGPTGDPGAVTPLGNTVFVVPMGAGWVIYD